MRLTTSKYTVILSLQTLLLITDWCINISLLLTRGSNAALLTLFIVQDICLLLALTILLLTFFSTYIFQTGLVYLLYERFRITLLVCMAYIVLTTVVNIWLLVVRWNSLKHAWSTSFLIIFIIQRFFSTIYYYYYKRAALRISDPRFHEDMEWVQNKMHQVRPEMQ
ncbi:unnamed protein product [Acanthoscelides obtectus]|uniref:Transmembrane protein 138 n=2 Tax=Acanthoscelides obtectus TaxID=200917 RepID=A0A9P0LF54_ACAOB|nr:unnamed protein product [Acanthoscelides obtectus]CAK1640455.1 Transmembrane protein 138 [Acanthoscelides obtectus]